MISIEVAEGESLRREDVFIYKWVIQDFEWCKSGLSVYPPAIRFKFCLCSKMNFIGELAILGDSCPDRRCRLEFKCTNHTNWRIQCHLCVENNVSYFNNCHFDQHKTSMELPLYHFLHDLEKAKFENGFNTLVCKILHVEYVTKPSPKISSAKRSKFTEDFSQLFESRKFCDVTFEVGDQKLLAHKYILACRSRVFEAMFEHEMTESKLNKVKIEDMEPEVFEEVLRFIYTDTVANVSQFAFELFIASDKYDLEKLKSICEKELADNIAIDNAAEILVLADLHRAEELKKYAMAFIEDNRRAVTKTLGWKELVASHSRLLAELYAQVA